MTRPPVPADGTLESLWWSQGARDGLQELARQEARNGLPRDPGQVLMILMQIHCPGKLRRKYR